MFRQADNVGLSGDPDSFILSFDGARKGQLMRRGEYIFAVDREGTLLNRLDWRLRELGAREEVYAYWVLWSDRDTLPDGSSSLSSPIWDKVKWLVWVTVEAWHEDTRNTDVPGSRFGRFLERVVTVTIYGEPNQGFQKLESEANRYENLLLTSSLMIRGVVRRDTDIMKISGMLYELCILFQDEVYFNGMQEILGRGKVRGASGQFGSVKVLCAEMLGYDRVMLEDPQSYVTFQMRPGSERMYVLGQCGRLPQIRNLVKTVVRIWNQDPEARAAFKADQNVSVI